MNMAEYGRKEVPLEGGDGPTPNGKSHEKFQLFFRTQPLVFRKRNYPLVLIDPVCQPHFIRVGTSWQISLRCSLIFLTGIFHGSNFQILISRVS